MNSPTQTFDNKTFLLSGEIGTELAWNIGRFTLAGYIRYIISPQQARRVDFNGVILNKSVSGTLAANQSGLWNGLSVRYLFKGRKDE